MKTTPNHHQHVVEQFGAQAQHYLNSTVHAQGKDLTWLAERLAAFPDAHIIDVGCGAGHASFVAAQQAARVTAYDLSTEMLNVVAQTAQQRGLNNIHTQHGPAESLPFATASADVVISRYSAHHWHDVGRALREIQRVLKPGGTVILMDVVSPGHPVLDIYLQTVEMLRDTSHVRNYAPGEWMTLLTESGFAIRQLNAGKLPLEFNSWIARMRTPSHFTTAILALQKTLSADVIDYFAIQDDGSFTTDIMTIEAQRA